MKKNKTLQYGLFTSILVALGPILWLFINVSDKNYESLPVNIALAIIGLAVLLFNIKVYLKEKNKGKGTMREMLRLIVDFLFYIVLIVAMVILFIAFYLGIIFIQEKLFIKGEYLTFMIKSPYSYLIFLVLILVADKIRTIISKNKRGNEAKLPDKYRITLVILLIYILITSVTVVTEDGIYDYSFYNLKGDTYKFSDVQYVTTGFKHKRRDKGEFFYNIQLESGKKFKLTYPSMTQPGKQYDDDTWQEYVHIDELIMNTGAKKNSSEKGSKYVLMDKIYVDKLLKVVRNK